MFDRFTNLYELSKTLRFELKPVGETQRLLEENNVFQKDAIIQKKYTETKKYFDRLHREFAIDSLSDLQFSQEDLEEYEASLKNFVKDKKQKTELEKQEKNLRKKVTVQFDRTAKLWAEKYSQEKKELKPNINFLSEEKVFELVLLEKYGKNKDGSFIEGTTEVLRKIDKKTGELIEEKEISIFEGWKRFTGYFDKFFETRKNFYKDNGTSTAIATRIVDNLRKFVDNKNLIENYSQDFLDFLQIPDDELELLKNTKYYTYFLLQGERKITEGDIILNDPKGIFLYNDIVGRVKSAINKFRQDKKNIDKDGKKYQVKYLKTLDKQILSEKEVFIEEIENEEELKIKLQEFLETGNKKIKILGELFSHFVKNAENSEKYDLKNIYFTKKGFENFSHKSQHAYDWGESLGRILKLTKQKDKGYKIPDFIKLSDIKISLENLEKTSENFDIEHFWKEQFSGNQDKNIPAKIDVSKLLFQNFLEIFWIEFQENLEKTIQTDTGEKTIGYNISSEKISQILENIENSEELKTTPEFKKDVKEFADNLLGMYQFSKYFSVEKKNHWNAEKLDLDKGFYDSTDSLGYYDDYFIDTYETIVQPYNLIRNYLTKKPWESVQKWKLNFELPTLSDGWDKNKESANASVILQKDKRYFLALMKKGNTHLFDEKNREKFLGNGYKKMMYKQMADPKRDFPKGVFSKKGIAIYNPSEEIIDIYKRKDFKTESENFSKNDLWKLIDFFKECIPKHPSWRLYDFSFSKTSHYNNLNDFYTEVSDKAYKISWENISEQYITEKNENGELYLFQIKNKDWNEGSTGTKNLHTLYFESLFSDENVSQNFVMKLNGKAEIFYRPKAIEPKKVERNFTRKIIEKERYTQDKIFFHLPMTLNRGTGQPRNFAFNQQINEFLANNKEVNILGIDRGEKHLAYYSIINQEGEILEDENGDAVSGSLNIVGNKDYHLELEQRAEKRKKERQDWQEVSDIKNLKSGYISQVVHKLAHLAIKHNAIIVFEDLNMRFKQIRGGIEKSAYQQLEKALIDKLNFLVDKKLCTPENAEKTGNLLKAYQLAAPVEAFKDMGKQTGIIFYTTASYTSKIDPVTGWRPNVYFKKGSATLNKENISHLSEIKYNPEKKRFEIMYDLKKVIKSDKAKYPSKTVWTVCSNVDRFRWNRTLNNNKGGYDEYLVNGENSITENLKILFTEYGIEIFGNILDQIKNLETKGNEKFFSQFLFFFQLICQIRNTDGDLHKKIGEAKRKDFENKENEVDTESFYEKISEQEKFDEDFILSPVEDKNGVFFDSRNPEKSGKNLPKNGDDNGAYNIARKGIITLERIDEWWDLGEEKRNKLKTPDLFITNSEWDAFATKSKKLISSLF